MSKARERAKEISNISFSFWLKTVERIIVIVAGIAAILPLWQFWSEAGQRELERNSIFILAHQACQELISELIEEKVRELNSFPGLTEDERQRREAEIRSRERISHIDPTTSQSIEKACLYIRNQNSPTNDFISEA